MKRSLKDRIIGKQMSKKWRKKHESAFVKKMKVWKKQNHATQRSLEAQQLNDFLNGDEDAIAKVKKQKAGDLASSPVDWWDRR